MRGSPPKHLLLLLLAFALIAVPLARLTLGNGRELVAETETSLVSLAEPMERLARVVLRFAHQPQTLSLLSGERDLLEGVDWSESPVELEVPLPWGKEGLELVVEARWDLEPGVATAVTVEVEPEGEEQRSETRWSDGGSISDVLTFEWK